LNCNKPTNDDEGNTQQIYLSIH